MADRSRRPTDREAASGWRRAALVTACGLLFAPTLRCSSDEPVPSRSRMLDEACRAGDCIDDGAARVHSGITADSYGLTLGPDPSSVTIRLPSVTRPDHDAFHVEVLARGGGADTIVTFDGCGPADAGEEAQRCVVTGRFSAGQGFDWYDIGGGLRRGRFESIEVVLHFFGREKLEVADIRIVTYRDTRAASCSGGSGSASGGCSGRARSGGPDAAPLPPWGRRDGGPCEAGRCPAEDGSSPASPVDAAEAAAADARGCEGDVCLDAAADAAPVDGAGIDASGDASSPDAASTGPGPDGSGLDGSADGSSPDAPI